MFGGKATSRQQWEKYYNSVSWETALRATGKRGIPGHNQGAGSVQDLPLADFQCFSDGSWAEGWNGGDRLFCYM